jgi:NAD(P)-dependent dehydrogenase (short-subunit alcohol dehydrogenase family)
LAVNHVAPFLLTHLLAGELSRRTPSAVVNLSSGAAKAAKLDIQDLQSKQGYGQFQAYARSKAANLIVSAMLAERWRSQGIAVVSYDPGFVRTGMASHTAGLLRVANTLGSPLKTEPAKAAEPILSLALWSDKLSASGLLFNVHGKQVKQPKFVGDSSLTHAVWQATEALAGHDGVGGQPVLDQLE